MYVKLMKVKKDSKTTYLAINSPKRLLKDTFC